ncbi:MAG: hypothetical protein ACP59X_18300 [Solidesulfovibrio sp. DCME]|uniref:hypothetical protein n=1 Tax=Solidesulfovibrio sp. DCME TaxID=3447380 RepID=UPI003D1411F6
MNANLSPPWGPWSSPSCRGAFLRIICPKKRMGEAIVASPKVFTANSLFRSVAVSRSFFENTVDHSEKDKMP